MGVLLGFGDAQLGLAVVGQILAEHVGQRFRGEGGGRGNARGVLGEHDELGQLRHSGTLEFLETGSTKQRVSSRARSARKFMGTTASPSSTYRLADAGGA